MSDISRSALVLVPLLALLAGCGTRTSNNPHIDDEIRLSQEQEKDLFIASSNLGPDTNVLIIATVPKVSYERGALVLRPTGRDLVVAQPSAWRAYTGTAISTEESRRLLQRADRLDQTVRDLSEAAGDLRSYLEDRSQAAHQEISWQEKEESRRREDAERATKERQASVGRVERQYETEIRDLELARDRQVAQIDQARESEIEQVAGKHSQAVLEISERASSREKQINADYAKQVAEAQEQYRLLKETAQGKGSDDAYLTKLKEASDAKVGKIEQDKTAKLDALHQDTAIEVSKAREETGVRLSDVRSRYQAQAERIKQDHAAKLARLQAEKEDTTRRTQSGGSPKPVEPPVAPSEAPAAPTDTPATPVK